MDFPRTMSDEDMELAIKEWKLSGCHVVRPWWEITPDLWKAKGEATYIPTNTIPVVVGDGDETARYIWNGERQEWKSHPYDPNYVKGLTILERP